MSILATAALYATLAFSQPQAQEGPKDMKFLPEVTYAALVERTTEQANLIVGRYQQPDFKPECVKTLNYFGALDDRVTELKELWKEIPEDKKNERLHQLTATLNTALTSANKVLRETYEARCGFCESLTEEQCGTIDPYLTILEEGIVKFGQLAKVAPRMSCEQVEDYYITVISAIEQIKGIERILPTDDSLLDLVKKVGREETRKTFWQKLRAAESALEKEQRECK